MKSPRSESETAQASGGADLSDAASTAARAFNKANAAFRAGDWATSLTAAEAALRANPALTIAMVLKARTHLERGEMDAARAAYDAALDRQPDNFSALLELGNLHRRAGAREKAIRCYDRAVAAKADDPRPYIALTQALEQSDRADGGARAAFNYQRALSAAHQAPAGTAMSVAEVHHRVGVFRLARGDTPRALEALRQARLTASDDGAQPADDILADIEIDVADALLRLGLGDEGHLALQRASQARSKRILSRLAELAFRHNLWQDAISVMRKCATHYPEDGGVQYALADLQAKSWRLTDALATLTRAQQLGFENETAVLALKAMLHLRMGKSDDALQVYKDLVETHSAGTFRSSVAMASLYAPDLNAAEVADLHRTLCAPLGEGARLPASFKHVKDTNRRPKIGFVTPDLYRQHPVNIFLQPMLQHWDPARLPLTLYFTGQSRDAQTLLARSRVPHWRECAVDDLAGQVEADEIDILIDLAGHTSGRQMQLFAQRMAPVQVTYLGYPGSTGVPNMDWIIGDPVVTPPETDPLYSERVARLPDGVFCYAPQEQYPDPAWAAPTDRPLTFGSFNTVPKLTGETLRVWSRILHAVSDARLLLKAPSFQDAATVERFQALFADQGIAPDRLEFRGPTEMSAMMQDYAEVDIGLDPFPYNGGTTTLQAMWMGVPVVTLEGAHFVSRMGASFMRAAGLPDWVAQGQDDYVAVARRMAGDRAALRDLKRGMRARLLEKRAWQPDCHVNAFCNLLEAMWPPA